MTTRKKWWKASDLCRAKSRCPREQACSSQPVNHGQWPEGLPFEDCFLFDYMFAKSELLVGDYIRNKLELRADGWSR